MGRVSWVKRPGVRLDWWYPGGLEVFDEAGVGKDAGLGQAIHAFSDFNNNVAIMDEWGKMVLFHNTFWNVFYWDTHIFRSFHGSA
eukprot:scaffold63643_cov24-Attheya_sp.AAC.1